MEILDIVNKNDEVIATASRVEVHKQGLIHRQVHIWVYNDKNQVLVHMRHKDKDNYPGLLDVAAGGHVSTGMDYLETALKELGEEYGLNIKENELKKIDKFYREHTDIITKSRFKLFDTVYLYQYNGEIENLDYQKEEVEFLEWWPMKKFFDLGLLNEEEKKKFVPLIFSEEIKDVFQKIKKMI